MTRERHHTSALGFQLILPKLCLERLCHLQCVVLLNTHFLAIPDIPLPLWLLKFPKKSWTKLSTTSRKIGRQERPRSKAAPWYPHSGHIAAKGICSTRCASQTKAFPNGAKVFGQGKRTFSPRYCSPLRCQLHRSRAASETSHPSLFLHQPPEAPPSRNADSRLHR